jgi:hypothetical protein
MKVYSILGATLAILVIATLAFVFLDTNDSEPETGQATVKWAPPTERVDGTVLDAVGGFRIYYGRDPENMERSIDVDSEVTEYQIDDLEQGDWYFAVSASSEEGLESAPSPAVKKSIEPSPRSRVAVR